MCGIAGFFNRDGKPVGQDDARTLASMGDQIAHRGPDDEQIEWSDGLGMVFRRLSIVDLEGGRQPLRNEDGSLILMVNGEIYNHEELRHGLKETHHFTSESDCEIVLHLYEEMGLDFLEKLNGMFALMLWDRPRQRLILARDRLGIKPLYYSLSDRHLLFGSEVKSLLAHPDCPRGYNWSEALSYYFQDGRPNAPLHSFFQGIDYLPGGSVLVLDGRSNAVNIRPYWDVDLVSAEASEMDSREADQVVEGYRDLLADSVHMRLMSDVEVGIFLSGGLDSVSIATFAARHANLHCFSLFNQSTFLNGDAEAAHLTAREMALPIHLVHSPLDTQKISPEDWKTLLWLCETHMAGPEQWFKFQLHKFAKATRPGLKVILLGQGSDEFNGGYCHELVKLMHGPHAKADWTKFMRTVAQFERINLSQLGAGPLPHYNKFLNTDYLAQFSSTQPSDHPWSYHIRMFRQSLQHYNLWHEDRTAAGNHIENRVPFLDHRLVAYSCNVPRHLHPRLFWEKTILKKAMKGQISDHVSQRQKRGFFHGAGQRFVYKMMFELLMADDRRLIHEAFGEGPHPILERRMIDRLILRIRQSDDYGMVSFLLQLVNMGLLDRMARETPFENDLAHTGTILSAVEVGDWQRDTEPFRNRWTGSSRKDA